MIATDMCLNLKIHGQRRSYHLWIVVSLHPLVSHLDGSLGWRIVRCACVYLLQSIIAALELTTVCLALYADETVLSFCSRSVQDTLTTYQKPPN